MRTLRHKVLIKISEEERRKMFEKPIIRDDGETVFLVTNLPAAPGSDASYSQGVNTGTVIAIGKDVVGIEVGDLAILDYLVDITEDHIVLRNKEAKVVCLDSRTMYHEKTLIAEPNAQSPRPATVYKKGELKMATMIVAVVRDGVIIPRWPYVFLEHVERESEFKIDEGAKIFSLEEEESVIVERKVLLSSDDDFKAGDMIMCESDDLFFRTWNNQLFDIIYSSHIFAVELK